MNAERAAEEARGLVRWLRPEFQNPGAAAKPRRAEIATEMPEGEVVIDPKAVVAKSLPWPKDAIEQVRAVADVLATAATPMSVEDVAARFRGRGPWKKRLPQMLDMLVALGCVQHSGSGFRPNTR